MTFKDKRTKIIATIGPASEDPKIIEQLINNGVNVFRFNTKHNSIEWHEQTVAKVQAVADKLKEPIGILLDLQGPEIRIYTKEEKDIFVKDDEHIKLGYSFYHEDVQIKIPTKLVLETLEVGDHFAIDDGFVQLKVVEKDNLTITAKILHGRFIKNKKGLNLIGKDLDLPSLIKDDIEKLHIATRQKVDFVALSFVRSKKDIQILRKQLDSRKIDAKIVSKVESQKGLDNIDEIIEFSDAVMIARGDLGIETPLEQIPYRQKEIIKKCRLANKPVIVATQMLQSMISSPMPTRAEATDVANAVFDGTDAVMLSEESAMGKFPIKAVHEMAKILKFNENMAEVKSIQPEPKNNAQLIVNAAIDISESFPEENISKIVVLSETGYTAKAVSSYRPKTPIIAATDQQKTVESLTMSYGIKPVLADFPSGKITSIESVLKQLKKQKMITSGDVILALHGQHWKKPGQTNAIAIVNIK